LAPEKNTTIKPTGGLQFFFEERTGGMNQARFSTLATAAAALVTQMALTSGAQAKVTEITNTVTGATAYENDDVLTEIYELPVTVGGPSYDVTFDPSGTADGKYFPNLAAAMVASGVLEKEIESLGAPYPFITGCPSLPDWSCGIVTPHLDNLAAVVFVTSQTVSLGTGISFGQPYVWAVWTAGSPPPVLTSVPEPPPAALLGIGMAGVAAARVLRRKKKFG
jgi:hypothetical protein